MISLIGLTQKVLEIYNEETSPLNYLMKIMSPFLYGW